MLKSPPSPDEHPLLGSFGAYRRDQLAFKQRLARDYGDYVAFRLGPLNFVQVNHPDLIKTVLVDDADSYHKAPLYKRIFSQYIGNGLLVSDGDFWARQRRLVQPAFHSARMAGYAAAMVEHTARLLDEYADGQQRDLEADMTRLTLEIVAKTLFDAEVTDDADAVGGAMAILVGYVIAQMRTLRYVPSWIPTRENRARNRALGTLNRVVMGMIAARRAGSLTDRGDLLSMLLLAQAEDGARMTDKQVRDEVMTLFLAGHETTSNSLTWLWVLLATHPAVEARLHAELDAVLGNRLPTYADLPALPYLEQVVKEALRLYPAVWGFSRQAIRDTELGGYALRKGTIVMIVPYITQRDGRWFDAPDDFVPERFAPGQEHPRYAYIPFGGGARTCIGAGFASLEMRLIVAAMASRWRLALVAGQSTQVQALVTLRVEDGVRVSVESRK